MFVPSETGYWISEQFARLSEILKDYDPYLELRWIPTDKRETVHEKANPYVIVDTRSNYIVRYASDLDDPIDILAELFAGDNDKGNVLSRLHAKNAAAEAFRMKEFLERMEEAKDLANFFLNTEKNFIKHNGILYDDQMRRYDER